MKSGCLLEISVESLQAAMAAERGGAHRIELCSNLSEGGTTPSPDLLRGVRSRVRLPIVSMIRPRGGSFVYSSAEFEAMERDIGIAKDCRMDGVVLGLLDRRGFIDVERTRHLVIVARPLPVTFHRAFDECADLQTALEDVIQTGATRLLTSGGKPTAPESLAVIGELVKTARNRIVVQPGSGVHAGNVEALVRRTRVREVHAALSSVVPHPDENLPAFEKAVCELATTLAACR